MTTACNDAAAQRDNGKLEETAALFAWRTFRASDGEKGGPNQSDGGPSLCAQAVTMDEAEQQVREGAAKLNPRFVEWLMNWPIGATDELPRVDRLRVLGNSIVPAQAALAWRILTEA